MIDPMIRRMRWWDLPQVVAIERAAYAASAWTPEQFWAELARVPESRHYLVAEEESRILGYAGVMVAGDAADIQTIAVAEAQRRRGLARHLLSALIEHAGERGVRHVHLEVRTGNTAAIGLYEGLGFRVSGHRHDYYGPGQDATLMTRDIP